MAWPSGGLADLRAWWEVLRDALRMAPHAAARPGTGEGALSAYVPMVLALVVAAHWLAERLQRAFGEKAIGPLHRMRALARSMGIEEAEGVHALDRMVRQPVVPDALVPIIPPWVITTGAEMLVLVGLIVLAARFVRPRLPLRPALALALSGFAAATLYDLMIAVALIRADDALGISLALDDAVDAQGRPKAGFDQALDRLQLFFLVAGIAAPLPVLAMVVCLSRGLRAAGHGRVAAAMVAAVASGASIATGFFGRRTAVGDLLVRLLSF